MRELQAQPGALASLGPGRKGLPGNAPFQDSRTTMCVAALFIALPVAVGFCFCSPSHSLSYVHSGSRFLYYKYRSSQPARTEMWDRFNKNNRFSRSLE